MHLAETEPTSHLYRADAAGVERVRDGITTSNGLGWSPDNTRMYYTDSIAHRIEVFEFDPASGVLSNPQVFAEDPAAWVPDGLTVDAEGCVWGAKWNGGRVLRYDPAGRVILDLRFPARRMTSCMFAGPRLDTLVVTSATGPESDEPLAGRVFLLDPGVSGLAETPAAPGVVASATGD
jgi:sugar lactone lactonase YvrE